MMILLSRSLDPLCMTPNIISRKLGLLEGNCWGMVAQPYLKKLLPEAGVSVIYDVAFTTEL